MGKLLFILEGYLHPLKFSSIGKGIAAKTPSGIISAGSRKC